MISHMISYVICRTVCASSPPTPTTPTPRRPSIWGLIST